MIRRLIIIILICFSIFSCRPQAEYVMPEETEITTWGDFFSSYWNSMNKNYIFWALDSPKDEWDRVFDKYMPLFRDLGEIEDNENKDKAFRYLFDISKELSDGHYSFTFGDEFHYDSYSYRLLRSAGYSDDCLYSFFLLSSDEQFKVLYEETDFYEGTESILFDSFGIDLLNITELGFSSVTAEHYLRKGCFFFWGLDDNDYLYPNVLGVTEDDILYISFPSFFFADYLSSDNAVVRKGAEEFLSKWRDYILHDESIRGVVIDMRGNTGGYNSDISLLWNCFISEDAYIMDFRGKDGMNRLDYGPWQKYIVHPNKLSEHDFDKPIAVLTNKGTVSNGEVTALFFKALRDYYGFDTVIIGDVTNGGLGSAFSDGDTSITPDEDPYLFNGGQFSIGDLAFVSTQSLYSRYRDGSLFEGSGIQPDIKVEWGLSEGNDNRLNAALDWIRSRTN